MCKCCFSFKRNKLNIDLIDLKKYTGDIYGDKKHGQGVLSWPDGRMYTGAFFADRRHGFGIFSSPNISEFKVFIYFGER